MCNSFFRASVAASYQFRTAEVPRMVSLRTHPEVVTATSFCSQKEQPKLMPGYHRR